MMKTCLLHMLVETIARYSFSPCNIYMYRFFFSAVKIKNFIGLDKAVLTSFHNLCFGSKSKKNVYLCISCFYIIKVGLKGTRYGCCPDVASILSNHL